MYIMSVEIRGRLLTMTIVKIDNRIIEFRIHKEEINRQRSIFYDTQVTKEKNRY